MNRQDPPDPRSSPPAVVADSYATSELEDLLVAAEAAGDVEAAEHYREALLIANQGELVAFRRRLSDYLTGIDRPHTWRSFRDEGIVGLILRVELGSAGLRSQVPGLTYWISEADDGYRLYVDEREASLPTEFARRTRRVFPFSELGRKQIEHLVAAQVTYADA